MEHQQQQPKRPQWMSLPLWETLQRIEPNQDDEVELLPVQQGIGRKQATFVTAPAEVRS